MTDSSISFGRVRRVVWCLLLLLAACGRSEEIPAATNPSPTQPRTTLTASVEPSLTPNSTPETPESQPGPKPTLTREEEIKAALQVLEPQNQLARSSSECEVGLQTQSVCTVVETVDRINRPEWGLLFPDTDFYLASGKRTDGYDAWDDALLFVEQAGQRFSVYTFDWLLKANEILVTDENRELIAQAFTLMDIPGYLHRKITFIEWNEIENPNPKLVIYTIIT